MDLKWPNHFQHLKSMITIMFKSIDSTTDVTLVCDDGKEINARKVVLCASSNFLNNAISRNENLKKATLSKMLAAALTALTYPESVREYFHGALQGKESSKSCVHVVQH